MTLRILKKAFNKSSRVESVGGYAVMSKNTYQRSILNSANLESTVVFVPVTFERKWILSLQISVAYRYNVL